MRKKEFLCFVLLFLWILPLVAQPELPGGFARLAREMGVDILLPTDAGYKAYKLTTDHYQPCQFAIYSRKEKLELRYLLEPFDSSSAELSLPSLFTGRLLLHLASNDDDTVIAGHVLEEATLQAYNADWGKVFFFRPKNSFSTRKYCQLLALAKKDKGIALAFFLTDNPNNTALENRILTLYFSDN